MLVLSRKAGERIVVGQSITITVIETRGGRVRLGITAPEGTPINREEVFWRLATKDHDEVASAGTGPRFFVESY